jgi:hypothetical protein
MKLQAFSFFHLNLAYSAIEVAQRKDVIERCYWPLLRLARARQLPFGIEVSAWTLETIAEIDPAWLAELRDLVTNGPCEFIGCGYAQLIGPLVPAEVNAANLRVGMQRYEQLLGMRPKIALVNEQAYAAGLVPLYREAGYEALIMEWNNPARAHPEWDAEWRYLPQYACGTGDVAMPLIWNKSVSFQKVQRYVHGEMELDEYLAYVMAHRGQAVRAFPVYGNDVEVFDFRPGRYMTEAPLHAFGEWQRIDVMYAALLAQPDLEMVPPSAVLKLMDQPGAGNRLHLETAAHPVPVKKQDKYNLLRWAVTGRDDLGINTQCWRIFEAMQRSEAVTEADWAELCYLWSSDFRTHITVSRWAEYQDRLALCAKRWEVHAPSPVIRASGDDVASTGAAGASNPDVEVARQGRFLEVKGQRFHLRLNCLRGLALESMVDRTLSEKSLCGTIHHGYFDDIQWAADYYSGHLVFESPGRPKVTDLNPVEPVVSWVEGAVLIKALIKTPLGLIDKQWRVDEAQGRITLSYRLHWPDIDLGALRLGHITLNPEAFSLPSLHYQTHNGGRELESFNLEGADFDHGSAVSFLISANQALGLTSGQMKIGDAQVMLDLRTDKSRRAAVGLVSCRPIHERYLCRFAFTLKELDDTSRGRHDAGYEFEFAITPQRS